MNESLSLTEIGIRYLSNYLLPIVAHENVYIHELSCLTPRLGNLLLKTIVELKRIDSSETNDHFLSLFNTIGKKDQIKCNVLIQLSELHFSSCLFITNRSFSKHLLSHEFIETIDLRNCNVTYTIFKLLTENFPRLNKLFLGQTENKIKRMKVSNEFFPQTQIDSSNYLTKPKLKYLSLESIYNASKNDSIDNIFDRTLTSSSDQLRFLDLSRNSAIDKLSFIQHCKQIHTLILYDILPDVIESSIDEICDLKTLSLLDLSFNRRIQEQQNYSKPTLFLAKLIRFLPKLQSLDISGTNLAGAYSFDPEEELDYLKRELSIDTNEIFTIQSSIAGLLLLKHDLEFLGLFDVDERGSSRKFLPAKIITGEHTEEMLTTSLSRYIERPSMLLQIVAHLFRLYNHCTIQKPYDAGKLVMDVMEKHLYDRGLQTSGSACLYYVVDTFQTETIETIEKYNDYSKRLLTIIVNAMNVHLQHSPMIRNGLLTISRIQMRLPNHIMCVFEPTVNILIKFIELFSNESVAHEQTLLHNALSVLNHVACSVDGEEKIFMGRVGSIKVAVETVRRYLSKGASSEIVEVAWTLLWNITDETAENCRRFIEDYDGLEVFKECLSLWPDKRDLIRNMLGLLGNVAEVDELRHYLVTPIHMNNFRDLLKRTHENDIEIPYNCGGVIANILSDGFHAWTINSSIEQSIVNQELYDAVQTWDLRKQRTINYRSLSPILRLLDDKYPSGCIIWAVWAMSNLTTVHPEKYCPLVRNENGEPLLSKLLYSDKISEEIRNYAHNALNNVQCFYDPPVPMDIGPDDEF